MNTLAQCPRTLALALVRFAALLLLAGFTSTVLIQSAPGLGVDERELDPRLAPASIAYIRNAHASRGLLHTWRGSLVRLASGDLGISSSFNRPVRDLLLDRWSATVKLAGCGLVIAWVAGFILAASIQIWRCYPLEVGGSAMSGMLLCMPAALIAYLLVVARAPAYLGITAAVFPRIFRYATRSLEAERRLPHVTAARARGVSPMLLFSRHLLPGALPAIVALAGTSVAAAIGAAIPVEVVLDIPGIAHLAWKAALSRDLSLIVSITLVLTSITLAANACSDLLISFLSRRPA